MLRRDVAITVDAETPIIAVKASSAVVKVRHKEEVLRFRVGWPLDASEVLATVAEAFRSGERSATPCEGDISHAPTPIFLYHGDQGRLLELSEANASDFVGRHVDPLQPIRLVTVARRASTDIRRTESQTAPLVSEEANIDLCPAVTASNTGAAVSTDTSERIGTAAKELADTAREVPAPSHSSLGTEFLTTSAPISASSSRLPSRTGHALSQRAVGAFGEMRQEARKAADKLGDALEGALEKFNNSLPMPWLSPENLEYQRVLQASADLHAAREQSAAESRKRLAKTLDKYQVKLRPVEADGNCQFRALSVQLYGDEAQHATLRKRVIEHLSLRRERYEGYMLGQFEEYLERMQKDGEWGDNVTLQAVSDLLHRDILVLTDRSGSELLELHPEIPDEKEEQQPLCVAFLTEVHYDAVVIDCEYS